MKKKIFIKGSGSGLGLFLAQKLKEDNYEVIVNLKNQKNKKKLVKNFHLKNIVVADLNDEKSRKLASKQIKKIFNSIM